MKDFYKKTPVLALILAADHLLLSVWTLLRRLLPVLTGAEAAGSDPAASLAYALLFALTPGVLCALSLRVSRGNARIAFYTGALSRALSAAAYLISLSQSQGVRLMPLITVLSLGAAIVEVSFFALCGACMHGHRTERLVFFAAAAVCALEQTAYIVYLFTSMRLAGTGFTAQLLHVFSAASSAQFFLAIVKGCVCAMAFGLVYIAKRDANKWKESEDEPSTPSKEE